MLRACAGCVRALRQVGTSLEVHVCGCQAGVRAARGGRAMCTLGSAYVRQWCISWHSGLHSLPLVPAHVTRSQRVPGTLPCRTHMLSCFRKMVGDSIFFTAFLAGSGSFCARAVSGISAPPGKHESRLQADRSSAGLVRGFAENADRAVATADMDWSMLERLAQSDEAKRQVSSLRSTFRDEMQKLDAMAPDVCTRAVCPVVSNIPPFLCTLLLSVDTTRCDCRRTLPLTGTPTRAKSTTSCSPRYTRR